MTTQHTPTPWHIGIKPTGFIYGPKGEQVADLSANLVPDIETVANAAFIVRACNEYASMRLAHEELVAALKATLTPLRSFDAAREANAANLECGYLGMPEIALVEAAIAKAEGK